MTDTAKRLAGPTIGIAADASLYVVPALTSTLLTRIHVVNTTAGQLSFSMGLCATNGTALAAGNLIYSTVAVAANGFLDVTPGLILNAAEALRWNASSGLTCTVVGVESA